MNNDNKRIIHTKLYSKIASEILRSVEGQLSDGMWENSPAMEKYWRFSNVVTAPDGEVIIEISKEYNKCTGVPSGYPQRGWPKWIVNGFNDWSDKQVLEWFAAKVKHIMQAEIKDDGHQLMKAVWSRYNDVFKTQYLSYEEKITVRDVYFVYDFLMGRDVDKKYNGDMSLKIVSASKSDEETKAEETRRAGLAKLQAEWTEARQRLDIEKRMKIKEIEEEFDRNVRQLNAGTRPSMRRQGPDTSTGKKGIRRDVEEGGIDDVADPRQEPVQRVFARGKFDGPRRGAVRGSPLLHGESEGREGMGRELVDAARVRDPRARVGGGDGRGERPPGDRPEAQGA